MNTAETITAELSGAIVLLGLGIGYPWLWLHYAGAGVLKLGRPPQPKALTIPAGEVAEPPSASPAAPIGRAA